MIQKIVCSGFVVVLICLSGCTSFRSAVVHRDGNDSLRVQNRLKKPKGVPVKLKVPSHVDVSIVETYFQSNSENSDRKLRRGVIPLEGGQVRLLDVETQLVYTDKVFTVDFVRPMSGTLDLSGSNKGLAFDSEQYFQSIAGEVEDTTIQDITNILGDDDVTSLFTSAKATSRQFEEGGEPNDIKRLTRVVAFQRFDINECGWESRLQEFVDQHLNSCAEPCGESVRFQGGMPLVEQPAVEEAETLPVVADAR